MHLAFASSPSVLTAATGLMAESSLGHDSPGHELVHSHKRFMQATTVLGAFASLAAYLTRARTDLKAKARGLAGAVLLATWIVMVLGADWGGLLVYRDGIGTRGEPPPEAPHGSAPAPSGTGGQAH